MIKFLDELKSFDLPPDDFVVFGSSCMAIRGLHVNHDIDIMVNDHLWRNLKTKYSFAKKDVLLLGENIECFNVWPKNIDFDNVDGLTGGADIIDGIRFASLDKVLEWKKMRMMEKDIKHIKIIEDYLGKM